MAKTPTETYTTLCLNRATQLPIQTARPHVELMTKKLVKRIIQHPAPHSTHNTRKTSQHYNAPNKTNKTMCQETAQHFYLVCRKARTEVTNSLIPTAKRRRPARVNPPSQAVWQACRFWNASSSRGRDCSGCDPTISSASRRNASWR